MPKWEYKSDYIAIIPASEKDDLDRTLPYGSGVNYRWQEILQDVLNKYGEQGWELVSIPEALVTGERAGDFALFKRPKT